MNRNIATVSILLVTGIAMSLCAVWGGSLLHVWSAPAFHPHSQDVFPGLIVIMLGIFSAGMSAFILCSALGRIECHFGDGDGATISAFGAFCASLLFGLSAAPLAAGSTWWTPWLLILFAGFLPVMLCIRDLCFDE